MDYLKVIESINSFSIGQNTTGQLYALAYLLIISPRNLRKIENDVIDILLDSQVEIMINGTEYTVIAEPPQNKNVLVSPYYNFSLCLISYIGIKSFISKNHYRKEELVNLQSKLAESMMIIKDELNDINMKTVGFELLVGKYINDIPGFENTDFAKNIINEREKRLSKNSKMIFLFSPEGYDETDIDLRNFISKENMDIYIFNSAEATIKFFDKLIETEPKYLDRFIDLIKNLKGLPGFFRGDRYDMGIIIDMLNSTGLIDNPDIAKAIKQKLDDLYMFSDLAGDYNQQKGFSITQGFGLYDLDTTSTLLKAFVLLDYNKDKAIDFKFNYFENPSNGLYYTYPGDNRIAPTALAHLLSTQVLLGKPDIKIYNYLKEIIFNQSYSDKYHFSKLYILYCMLTGLIDYHSVNAEVNDTIEEVIRQILSFRKSNGMFSSIKGFSSGTAEETAWAILALTYYVRKVNDTDEVRNIIRHSSEQIQGIKQSEVKDLVRLWYFKQVYTPIHCNMVLFAVAQSLKDII